MLAFRPASPARRLRMPWKRLLTVGRAFELLRADLLEHLRLLRREIGFEYLRFHALFHDEMRVYAEDSSGRPVYQWKHVDRVLDDTLALGFRHVIELNSMPALLASGDRAIFNFKMNVTSPRDYAKWEALVRAFVEHCAERHGIDEILHWYFECWNEPDLEGFWSGTQEEYFQLYAASARAVKSVHPALRVGGPASSRGRWVAELVRWCRANAVPLDFVSTHQYPQDEYCLFPDRAGSPHAPDRFFVDSIREVRATVDREAGPGFPLLYTEWNTQNGAPGRPVSWENNPDLDTLYSGSAALHYCSALDRTVDMLGWWTASDLFEFQDALGMPSAPFSHGGYGLVTVRGTPKPAFHALRFLSRLTGRVLEPELPADRPPLAGALASEHPDRVRVLVWNHQSHEETPRAWSTRLRIPLPPALSGAERLQLVELAVGVGHGSAYEVWRAMGEPQNLGRTEEDALRLLSEPACRVLHLTPADAHAEWQLQLEPRAFAFFELSLPGAPTAAKPAGSTHAAGSASALNRLLSYQPR